MEAKSSDATGQQSQYDRLDVTEFWKMTLNVFTMKNKKV